MAAKLEAEEIQNHEQFWQSVKFFISF